MIIDDSDIWEQITKWSNGAIESYGQSRAIKYDHSEPVYEHRNRICESCD